MKKVTNEFVKNLHYLFLISVVALGLLTIVGTNGGGSGGDSISSPVTNVTLLDENDINTFHGTYKVEKMEAFYSNGIRLSTDDLDYFRGYMAVDVDNERIIVDLYAIDKGYVIFDMSDVRTPEYYDNFRIGGADLVIDGVYMIEYIFDVDCGNGIYGDFVYHYKKISNEVESQYFDILSTSSTQATKSIMSADSNLDILVGLTLLGQIVEN